MLDRTGVAEVLNETPGCLTIGIRGSVNNGNEYEELNIMTSTFKIKGMSCNHCVMAVTKALNEVEGITKVQVDLDAGQATVEHGDSVDVKVIIQQIGKAGYEIG